MKSQKMFHFEKEKKKKKKNSEKKMMTVYPCSIVGVFFMRF